MLSLLHISDLHFGWPYLPQVGEAVLQSAHDLSPDLIVASGDFTQDARPDQFHLAQAFLAQLPKVPIVVTPGNHDVPRVPRLLVTPPFALYQKCIHPELDYVLRHEKQDEKICLVSLNSVSKLGTLVNGRLSEAQLQLGEQWFAGVPEDFIRVVVAHHHFAPAPDLEGGSVMREAKRAIDRFVGSRVELILGGHLHRSYIGNSLDFYPAPDRDRGIIIVQSGTSTSRRGRVREREKNSFNLIHIDQQLVRITHYLYFSDLRGFAPASEHFFPRASQQHLAKDALARSLASLEQAAKAQADEPASTA